MSIYHQTTGIDYCYSYLPLLKSFDLCFNNTPITTFCYLRYYSDGRLLYLSNNETWLKPYVHEKYYNNVEHINCYTANDQGGYYIWIDTKSDYVLLKAEEMNILNGINFCRKNSEFCEVFVFCSSIKNNNTINFYMNNAFKIKDMATIFHKEFLSKIKFSPHDFITVSDEVTKKISDFCKNKNNSKIKINDEMTIGNKALACLYWMCQGKSADETAMILGVSRRTVEDHFNVMKIKTNASSKSQLIYKILSMQPNIINEYNPDNDLY